MKDAETYLIKKANGTRLSHVVHEFVVELLTSYLSEGVRELTTKYEKKIERLNKKLVKAERVGQPNNGSRYATPIGVVRKYRGPSRKPFDNQKDR